MLIQFFKHLTKIFLVIDYCIINVFLFALNVHFFRQTVGLAADHKAIFFVINIVWLAVIIIIKPYKSLNYSESSLHFNKFTKAFFLFFVSVLITLEFLFSPNVDFSNVLLYFSVTGCLMLALRFWLFFYRKSNRIKIGRRLYSMNTVLVGENKMTSMLLEENDVRRALGIRGVYTASKKECKNKYLGGIEQLVQDVEAKNIKNIIFCNNDIELEVYKRIANIAEQKMIRIYMVPGFKYASLGPHYYDLVYGVPFLKLIREPLANSKKQLLKRVFDIGFSILVIVFVLSWLVPLVAIIVKIESNESVFFRQKRSGLNNEPFQCIKFRSMTSNKNADLHTATKNDKRVTKFGGFMRKTSIDELPQFFNVFMGQMSIVGPRPHMLSQTDMYSKITDRYMTRHIVKPGITGWAQVTGSRGEIFSHRDMERRIEKDVWYIQNWSFFLDLKIIFLTIYNVIKGDKQAY